MKFNKKFHLKKLLRNAENQRGDTKITLDPDLLKGGQGKIKGQTEDNKGHQELLACWWCRGLLYVYIESTKLVRLQA